MGREQREYPRLEQEFSVNFDIVPNDTASPMPKPQKKGIAKNISGGGMHFAASSLRKGVVKKLLSHSCKLNMEFYLPDFQNRINVLGEVRWAKDGFHWWSFFPTQWELGVKFVQIQQADKDSIIKYVINKQIEEQLAKTK